MPYLGIFGYILENLLSYLKSAPSNFSACNSLKKKRKYPNSKSKMPYLSIFGLDFKKTIVILEISTIKFVKL